MARQKHIPMRTCVSCGAKSAKRELLRIVASKSGEVQLDPSGKAQGRGAYVCTARDCTPGGLSRGRVQHALRLEIDDDRWDDLTKSLAGTLAAPG